MGRKRLSRTVTLQDIADRIHCSRNTASLAMRDSPRISETVRRKIQSTARRMGYVPNLAARNLITRRSGMIGLYVRVLQDAVRRQLAESLLKELHTAKYCPVLGVSQNHFGEWQNSPWMKTFQAIHVEALVIVGEAGGPFPKWIRRIPRVLVANYPNKRLDCDYVALDRAEGARIGVEYLLQQGHRDILIACGPKTPFAKGCVQAMHKAGLATRMLEKKYTLGPELADATIKYLTVSRKRPSAILFGDSPTAVRFLHELHRRTKLRCPKDLAVIGYDYFPWADILRVPLTTIEQPIAELATTAVDLIKFRLANPDVPPKHVVLAHKLVVRHSA